MGTTHGKVASCPFDQLQNTRIKMIMSMRFRPGEASDFYFLCKEGKIDEIRQILDDETSPSIEELNQLQPNGSTPLHAATYYNHLEIVKLLLEYDCPRTTLNLYNNTAYDEAQSIEMKELFQRPDSTDRFHERNTTDAISMFFPREDIESVNVSKTAGYVQLFETASETFEYALNQQTTAMWLNFYNWFIHRFRTFTERDDVHIDTFDLTNHPDFQEFLKRSLSDPAKYEKTMESVNEAKRRNSIEPLIKLYTREDVGFYRPFNRLLSQSSTDREPGEHLCDRFIIEFHIRHQELKQRAFTGTVYRGATVPADSLYVYYHARDIQPMGVLGLKSFTSASKDPLVALNFALKNAANQGETHVLFIFEIMEVTPTIFGISDVSQYSHEQEVLILPGNLFTVTKIEKQSHPPMTKIYLRHISIPISFIRKIKQTLRSGKKTAL